MLNLQTALQQALENAYTSANEKMEYWVEKDGIAITPFYSAQSLANSFTEEELKEMDFWILAGEIIESLNIPLDEKENYIVVKSLKK